MSFFERNKKDIIIFLAIVAFWAVAYYIRDLPLTPPGGISFNGDTRSYVDSVSLIETGILPSPDFTPNRLLTNFAYLKLLVLFRFLGIFWLGWMALNSLFYIMSGFILYKIIYRIFVSDKIAGIGTALYLGNYVAVTFGLHYLTDMGSFMFYLAAAYFSLEYIYTDKESNMFGAGLMTGVGGLFKEYALGGYFVIVGALLYSAYQQNRKVIKHIMLVTLISFVPVLLVHLSVYIEYHYTYLDFYNFMRVQPSHAYSSKIVEHAKALFYMYNVGFLLLGYSVYLIRKNRQKYFDDKTLAYLFVVFISASPIFIYPGITERLDFIVAPFLILISCVAIKEHEDKWRWFLPLVAIYLVASFSMDAYILQPEWKQTLIGFLKNIL
ncbi:MAG: glycosyltransferase family 39 protein [Candidatus Vogelbacteria bacterium]|nr:glycosyltransferase family 39 protein [Candidatus Vogelbacteria bacterium]